MKYGRLSRSETPLATHTLRRLKRVVTVYCAQAAMDIGNLVGPLCAAARNRKGRAVKFSSSVCRR